MEYSFAPATSVHSPAVEAYAERASSRAGITEQRAAGCRPLGGPPKLCSELQFLCSKRVSLK
jgi:hypothetical protein